MTETTTDQTALPYSPEEVARFRANVDAGAGPDACHPWLGRQDAKGYGVLSIGGQSRRAHRVAYELATGRPFPAGLMCRHVVCHCPGCVNPRHLAPGSAADNSGDMVAAGRSCRGERNGQARLSADKVRAIRALYRAGGWTSSGLGHLFGVSGGAVLRVLTGQTWAWVPISAEEQAAIAQRLRDADVGKAGAGNPKARLDAGRVRAIRRRHAAGESMASLARRHSVSETAIRKIIRRVNWGWLPDEAETPAPDLALAA